MQIPFVGGSYTAKSPNINAQRSINLFPHVDNNEAKTVLSLIGTPGLKAFATCETEDADSCCRCCYEYDSSTAYVVMGPRVYSVTSAGVAALLGTITTSSGPVFMERNTYQVLIVDGSTHGYYIQAGALSAISDADYPQLSAVTMQDNYFIGVEYETGRFWQSGLNDATTWDALDFYTAEGKPDNAVIPISTNQELWVLGEKTTEIYYNNSGTFTRISGAVIDVGCMAVASAIKIDGQLYWLSNNGQIVRNQGYQFQPLSTPHVDKAIAGYATISDATAYCYRAYGHNFYVINFPTEKKTWVYDITTAYWHEWESYNNKDDSTPWSRHRGSAGMHFNRKYIVGDYENGKLYELDLDTYTDNSQQIRRQRVAQTISKDNLNVIHHRLEIEFEAGVGLSGGSQGEDPKACLDWSNDGGHTWSNERWASIGKIGEYRDRAIFKRLGMARSRVYRLTISDPVKVVILAAYAELEACRA